VPTRRHGVLSKQGANGISMHRKPIEEKKPGIQQKLGDLLGEAIN
jgi:hypothetical protein